MLIGTYVKTLGPEFLTETERATLADAGLLKLNITETKRYVKANAKSKEGKLLERILKRRDQDAMDELRKMRRPAPKSPVRAAPKSLNGNLFPRVGDEEFAQKLVELPQVLAHQSQLFDPIEGAEDLDRRTQEACGAGAGAGTGGRDVELMMHQRFVQRFLSEDTPYRGMLLYHQVGVGKTCSAIAVAESFLEKQERELRAIRPVVVIASRSLHQEFQRQVFDLKGTSCVGSRYLARAKAIEPGLEGDMLKNKVMGLIRARYMFLGYEEFANRYEESPGDFEGRLVIVDEVHNMRKTDATKQVAVALESVAKRANNRLLFMTATPMYNEVAEFYQLLALLCWNDGRDTMARDCVKASAAPLSDKAKQLVWRLSSEYVSFVRGTNPVAFPYKMDARLCLEDGEILTSVGVPTTGWHKSQIPAEETEWHHFMPSVVAVEQSALQKKVMKDLGRAGVSITALNQELAYNNIVFPQNKLQHRDGLMSGMFMSGEGVFKSREDFLTPAQLPEYAPKLAKVLEVAQKCEGIAVIYSQYIWNGILPLALALEYMGYQNWSKNLLDERGIKPKKAKYAILCGDAMFTAANLAGVIREINDTGNKNGEKIKFVLISQVASEGISFKNVRSVHVVDPWFHFNRTEQIIGRAVRTCSHVKLPVEKRNVGIFLYALRDGMRETADIYTYRMAAAKRREILKLNQEIASHAVDCYLHRSKNFYPPSAPVEMVAPTGKKVRVVLGDASLGDAYTCAAMPQERRYSLADFTPRELHEWREFFLGQIVTKSLPLSVRELKKQCGVEGRVMDLLFSYALSEIAKDPVGTKLYFNADAGQVAALVPKKTEVAPAVWLQPPAVAAVPAALATVATVKGAPGVAGPSSVAAPARALERQVAALATEAEQKVLLYGELTPDIYDWVVRNMDKVPVLTRLLDSEGAFVYAPELEGRKRSGSGSPIGHFDIFHVESRLDKEVHPVLYLWKRGEAPLEEVEKVARVRGPKKLPAATPAGVCSAFVARQKKGASAPELRLKVFDLTPGERAKTGFDCQQTSTFGVPIVKEKLAAIVGAAGVPSTNSKAALCTALAVGLSGVSKQAMLFPPYLHPIV